MAGHNPVAIALATIEQAKKDTFAAIQGHKFNKEDRLKVADAMAALAWDIQRLSSITIDEDVYLQLEPGEDFETYCKMKANKDPLMKAAYTSWHHCMDDVKKLDVSQRTLFSILQQPYPAMPKAKRKITVKKETV